MRWLGRRKFPPQPRLDHQTAQWYALRLKRSTHYQGRSRAFRSVVGLIFIVCFLPWIELSNSLSAEYQSEWKNKRFPAGIGPRDACCHRFIPKNVFQSITYGSGRWPIYSKSLLFTCSLSITGSITESITTSFAAVKWVIKIYVLAPILVIGQHLPELALMLCATAIISPRISCRSSLLSQTAQPCLRGMSTSRFGRWSIGNRNIKVRRTIGMPINRLRPRVAIRIEERITDNVFVVARMIDQDMLCALR